MSLATVTAAVDYCTYFNSDISCDDLRNALKDGSVDPFYGLRNLLTSYSWPVETLVVYGSILIVGLLVGIFIGLMSTEHRVEYVPYTARDDSLSYTVKMLEWSRRDRDTAYDSGVYDGRKQIIDNAKVAAIVALLTVVAITLFGRRKP